MFVGIFGTWATFPGGLSLRGITTHDGKELVLMAGGAAGCLWRYAQHGGGCELAIATVFGVLAAALALLEIVDLGRQGPLVGVGWGIYLEAIAAGVLAGSSAKLRRSGI